MFSQTLPTLPDGVNRRAPLGCPEGPKGATQLLLRHVIGTHPVPVVGKTKNETKMQASVQKDDAGVNEPKRPFEGVGREAVLSVDGLQKDVPVRFPHGFLPPHCVLVGIVQSVVDFFVEMNCSVSC